jgi:hypothetical protein
MRKSPPKFNVGADVRVKRGVIDPDFNDIPIGGWTGRITEMQSLNPPMYLIRWDQQTLGNIHPIYRKRCERDGFDIAEMWLAESDLEPGSNDPVNIEQPTKIVTKPLNRDDQDDRIRSVFGLTSDDPLPESDEESLRAYYKFLTAKLSFPFEAKYSPQRLGFGAKTHAITVLGLLNPEEFPGDGHGLFCQVRRDQELIEIPLTEVEACKGSQNHKLIKDYTVWFVNW